MYYSFDFQPLIAASGALLRGIGVTLELFFIASLLGTVLGAALALLTVQSSAAVNVTRLLLDIVKAVPILVLMFFVYYFPYREAFGVAAPSPFVAVTLALTLAQAAYSADLIRVALLQVPGEQLLGLRGIGLSEQQIHRHLTLPWTVRTTFSAHLAMWIGNIKLSSLASLFGVADVVYVAKLSVSQNFRSFEAWIVVALIYIALVLPLTYAQRRLERLPFFQCEQKNFS